MIVYRKQNFCVVWLLLESHEIYVLFEKHSDGRFSSVDSYDQVDHAIDEIEALLDND